MKKTLKICSWITALLIIGSILVFPIAAFADDEDPETAAEMEKPLLTVQASSKIELPIVDGFDTIIDISASDDALYVLTEYAFGYLDPTFGTDNLNVVYKYDPELKKFTAKSPIIAMRGKSKVIYDGIHDEVLMLGGENAGNTVYMLDPIMLDLNGSYDMPYVITDIISLPEINVMSLVLAKDSDIVQVNGNQYFLDYQIKSFESDLHSGENALITDTDGTINFYYQSVGDTLQVFEKNYQYDGYIQVNKIPDDILSVAHTTDSWYLVCENANNDYIYQLDFAEAQLNEIMAAKRAEADPYINP